MCKIVVQWDSQNSTAEADEGRLLDQVGRIVVGGEDVVVVGAVRRLQEDEAGNAGADGGEVHDEGVAGEDLHDVEEEADDLEDVGGHGGHGLSSSS